MKGVLKNKEGKWVVEYYYMRTSSHTTHPNLTELPLHPSDVNIFEDLIPQPNGKSIYHLRNDKEVEFEIVEVPTHSSGVQQGYDDFSKFERYAKLITPKQEESSNWDEIFKLYNYSLTSLKSSSPHKLKIWLKENYYPPVKK